MVEHDSATLGLPPTREMTIYLNRSHTTLCKFSGVDEPEWQQVSSILLHAVTSAARALEYSPSMDIRQAMFEDNLSWNFCDAAALKTTNNDKNNSKNNQVSLPLIGTAPMPLSTAVSLAQSVLDGLGNPTSSSSSAHHISAIQRIVLWFTMFLNSLGRFLTAEKAENQLSLAQKHLTGVVSCEEALIRQLEAQRLPALQAVRILQASSAAVQQRVTGRSTNLPREATLTSMTESAAAAAEQVRLAQSLERELTRELEEVICQLHVRQQTKREAERRLRLVNEAVRDVAGKSVQEIREIAAELVSKEREETLRQGEQTAGLYIEERALAEEQTRLQERINALKRPGLEIRRPLVVEEQAELGDRASGSREKEERFRLKREEEKRLTWESEQKKRCELEQRELERWAERLRERRNQRRSWWGGWLWECSVM